MQLKDSQDMDLVLPPLTIEAIPRAQGQGSVSGMGRYNFVLLHQCLSLDNNHDQADLEDYGIRGMYSHIIIPTHWQA